MNPNIAEKLWATAMHPSTNDNEASNAFVKLRQSLSSSGGVESYIKTKFSEKSGRSDSEWADMYFRLSNRLEVAQREHSTQIATAEEQHKAAMARTLRRVSDAERALKTKEEELAEAQAQGGDDLGVIDQRNAEIRGLIERLKEAKAALNSAEECRERYAAEKVIAAEQEIKKRVLASLEEGTAQREQEPEPQPTRRRRAQASAKRAASAPKRPRARKSNGRGANNDNLVLSLLTNEWKSTGCLFAEAQRYGFKGSENALRFAAQRLAEAGNAMQGRDDRGRIAFRRA
jgi:hypothetical protein